MIKHRALPRYFLPGNIRRMKYVCSTCGKMLSVDRDLDEDRMVENAIAKHRFDECPGDFPSENVLTLPIKGSAQHSLP